MAKKTWGAVPLVVLATVREMKSPYHGDFRGFRFLAAVPNREGRAFGKVVPSFKKPYLLYLMGDFSEVRADLYARFEQGLRLKGARDVIWLE